MSLPVRTVMHVIANLNSGGVQSLLAKSLAHFDHQANRHLVCCVTAGGVYEQELQALQIPYWIMRRRARFDPTVLTQMAKLMRREQVDVVHTLNFTANAWGRVAARRAGVKRVIAHERGTGWTENAVMRQVDRWLYRWTDVWLANSQAARAILTQHIGLPTPKIKVVYNGVPEPAMAANTQADMWAAHQIDPARPIVMTIGRLDTQKGLDFLLSTIPLVWQKAPETQFVVVGDGPLATHVQARAQALKLFEHKGLYLPGFVRDAHNLLPQASLLLHPAIREAFGNVLVEAAFAGVPVVATNVDGCAEVVVDGETGLLVDGTEPISFVPAPGASPLPRVVVDGQSKQLRPPLGPNPAGLAEAVLHLLNNDALRKQMGQQAQNRAKTMFSIQRYVQALEQVYQDHTL